MQKQIKPLIWQKQVLQILDQRVLPFKMVYIDCFRAQDVLTCIQDMAVRGAPLIGICAAFAIAIEAQLLASFADKSYFRQEMERAFLELKNARPTAVFLATALHRMHSVYQQQSDLTLSALADILYQEALNIYAEEQRINQKIAEHGLELIGKGSRILTHCNTGCLASADMGTALGLIRYAHQEDKRIKVWVTETRPLLQGARLTAWELQQANIPFDLIVDSAAAYLMQKKEIDMVLIGADRLAKNGDVVNKIGSYMLALAAHYHGIPFYVACPSSSIDHSAQTGEDIDIEERAAEEILGYRQYRWTPEAVAVRNPAFDMTPQHLVTAVITEQGII